MKKALCLLLAVLMVVGLAACAKKPASGTNSGTQPANSGTQQPANSGSNTQPANSGSNTQPANSGSNTQPANSGSQGGNNEQPPVVEDKWDGAYIDHDDYTAYRIHDLNMMVESIEDQLDDATYSVVKSAEKDGEAAIAAAETLAEARAAYQAAFDKIVKAIPLANGIVSYKKLPDSERTNILGILERFAVATGLCGVSLFENGSYVMYNPRITLGTENYIVGYGFGILPEGAVTADLDYETNDAWKRYYHTYEVTDPGTLNYLNDQGSQVGDLYNYIGAAFYTNFMNATKDGYDWVPELAKEKPVPVNDDDGDGMCTTWRFRVRTGDDGLKYYTGSSIASRAAFNGRPVALEDYETAFKLLLTKQNNLYRGSELANQSGAGGIAGAKAYYDGTADGYNADLWAGVGIKTYVENGESYFEVTWLTEQTSFYSMYYIASNLYMPVPQDFLDLVGVANYLSFNEDATESPADNSLSLGAYYCELYVQDQQIVYGKNPNYVFADTKYSIPGVHVKIFNQAESDTNAGLNAFLAGQFDSAGIPQEHLDEYRNDPRTHTTTGTSNFKLNINACDQETWEYLFGVDGVVAQNAREDYWDLKPIMGNHHFIQGLSYSINRLQFASARGSIPAVDYLSSNYMIDPENGLSYSVTSAHKNAVAQLLDDTDGYGYSLELARDYFRLALTELEADGAYVPGTKENPNVIHIEIAWMYPTHEENYHNEIKNFIETAFNDESVCGGVYQLSCDFWVGNQWSDVYYNKLMVGQYDLGFGSISGNSLDPIGFVEVLSSNQDISGNFTLNWGVDTNSTDVYPIVYDGYAWSFDALLEATNSSAVVANGKYADAVNIEYTEMTANADGSYTGSFTLTPALPDKTVLTATDVMCCNYERYYNGDGNYAETPVEFTQEIVNGSLVVTFTVPAELADDYKTGSGTSEEPEGYTGFDLYYDMILDGNASSTYYSAYDYFNVD